MFKLIFETDGEEFQKNPEWVVAGVLRTVADQIQLDGKKAGHIWNKDGTLRIGGFILKLED